MFSRKKFIKSFIFFSAIMIILSMFNAIAASNYVPTTYAMDKTFPIDQNQFVPAICKNIVFDNIISGSGKIQGTPGNDLIFGSDGDDDIKGVNGDDCILGGGGNDLIFGQNGDDIIDGGPGEDTIDGGPGNDTCLNGENVSSCEY